jgi:tetratricopeptide (TPR) repeat protein
MKLLTILLFLLTLNVWSETDFDKAEKLFEQQKWELAKPLFENYLKENPTDLKTIEYLGDIAGHLQNWDNCIYYYNKLKTSKPTQANYWYKYGGSLGMKASQNKSFESLKMVYSAEDAFKKAIALDPNHIEARYALITLNLRLPGFLGGSEKKAQKYANELMTLSKVDGYLAKGTIDEYFGRYSKAETNYLKAHEIGNSKITLQKLNDLRKKTQSKAP